MNAKRLKGFPVAVGLVAALLLAASCGGDQITDVPPDASLVPGAQVDTLLRTLSSGVRDRRRMVIRSQEAWEHLWNRAHALHSPVPDPPTVDFRDALVIGVSMGERRSGGYRIEIDEVARVDSELYVVVREVSPGDSCVTTAALSAPLLAVRVSGDAERVLFVERRSVHEC